MTHLKYVRIFFIWVLQLYKAALPTFDLHGHAQKHTKLQTHSIAKKMETGD